VAAITAGGMPCPGSVVSGSGARLYLLADATTKHYSRRVRSKDTVEQEAVNASPPGNEESRVGSEILELSREECLELLATHHFGRLAVVMSNGAPVIRPVNYVFDKASQSVMLRTGRGSKLHAALHAKKAAFEIDGIDESTRTGWSVVIEGATAELASPSDQRRLRMLGLEPWAPGPKPHWVHIRAWTVSGRRIVLPASKAPQPQ
jgi:uncharacterized protein